MNGWEASSDHLQCDGPTRKETKIIVAFFLFPNFILAFDEQGGVQPSASFFVVVVVLLFFCAFLGICGGGEYMKLKSPTNAHENGTCLRGVAYLR